MAGMSRDSARLQRGESYPAHEVLETRLGAQQVEDGRSDVWHVAVVLFVGLIEPLDDAVLLAGLDVQDRQFIGRHAAGFPIARRQDFALACC